MIVELNKNLQMLDAVLSLPKNSSRPSRPLLPMHQSNVVTGPVEDSEPIGDVEAAYARTSNAVADLNEWIGSLYTNLQGQTSRPLAASLASLQAVGFLRIPRGSFKGLLKRGGWGAGSADEEVVRPPGIERKRLYHF